MEKSIIRGKMVKHENTQLESDSAGNVTATNGSGTGIVLSEAEALRLYDLLTHLISWGSDI